MSHTDKENGSDGVYIFERNVQDNYYSLKLESISSFFCARSAFNLLNLIGNRLLFDNNRHSETIVREESLLVPVKTDKKILQPDKNQLSNLLLACFFVAI